MGTTPNYGLPYPEADTLITDSAAIVQELAEKIDAALAQANASDSYTVPGTLVEDFTASGTFTPPAGVTVVHVVVIGGGGKGGDRRYVSNMVINGGGGSGGGVRVYRDVPVSGPVSVTVGGATTESSFGIASAPAGNDGNNNWYTGAGVGPGLSPNGPDASNGGYYYYVSNTAGADYWRGQNGVQVNGTYYAGGGGGGGWSGWDNNVTGSGGAGGGGVGAIRHQNHAPGRGSNGLGGGGGGGSYDNTNPAGVGGSGRVMVYTEQAYKSAHAPRPAPDPTIVAAIDDHDQVLGVYAVDPAAPDLPGIPYARLVDYPTDPIDTGRTVTVLDDPDDPNSPTHDEPVLARPAVGWTYTDTDGWKEPTP